MLPPALLVLALLAALHAEEIAFRHLSFPKTWFISKNLQVFCLLDVVRLTYAAGATPASIGRRIGCSGRR